MLGCVTFTNPVGKYESTSRCGVRASGIAALKQEPRLVTLAGVRRTRGSKERACVALSRDFCGRSKRRQIRADQPRVPMIPCGPWSTRSSIARFHRRGFQPMRGSSMGSLVSREHGRTTLLTPTAFSMPRQYEPVVTLESSTLDRRSGSWSPLPAEVASKQYQLEFADHRAQAGAVHLGPILPYAVPGVPTWSRHAALAKSGL